SGHVLEPLRHLARGRATHVTGDVGLTVEQLDQLHELMGAEGVVLLDPAPVRVDAHRALVARTNAVAPVVFVGEAAAGPTDDRDLELLERLEHVGTEAACIGNGGILAYPDAAVNAATEVLRELAVQVTANSVARPIGPNRQLDVVRERGATLADERIADVQQDEGQPCPDGANARMHLP